jgi:hypothetical protein
LTAGLIAAACLSCRQAPGPRPGVQPLYAFPESTIYAYWSCLDRRDYAGALTYFKSHRNAGYDSSLIYHLPASVESLTVDSIISRQMIGDLACVIRYRVRFYSLKDQRVKSYLAGDKLVWTEGAWKIDEVLSD